MVSKTDQDPDTVKNQLECVHTICEKIHNDEDPLFRIQRRFLQGAPPRAIPWSLVPEWSLETQQKLMTLTIQSPIVQNLPPCQSHCRSFLKSWLRVLEDGGVEVDESILDAYVRLLDDKQEEDMQSRFRNTKTYKHYVLPRNGTNDSITLSLSESPFMISQGSTGLRTWPASLCLISFLSMSRNREWIAGKNILELGTGAGLLGIACAFLGSASVTLTDLPDLLHQIDGNVALNRKNISKNVTVSVKALDWESSSSDYLSTYGPIDTVVCADVVYDSSLIQHLVKVLHGFLSIGVTRVLLSQTIRQEATTEELMQELTQCGISVATLPWTGHHDSSDPWFYLEDGSNDIRLYSLTLLSS